MLALAFASKVYRENEQLRSVKGFSNNGDEVIFGTIGDASTSEGLFFEAINAAGVLQVPLVISVWDDGYGISVSKKYQTTKESISKVLAGFQKERKTNGLHIVTAKGWDYPALVDTYEMVANIAREKHEPVLLHVEEMTQPQGHSTSGSHERYKTEDRLKWEDEFDCIRKMREWIESSALATAEELDAIEAEAKTHVKEAKNEAWKAFISPIKQEMVEASALMEALAAESSNSPFVLKVRDDLQKTMDPLRKEVISSVRKVLQIARGENTPSRAALSQWYSNSQEENRDRFNSYFTQ